MSESGVTGKLRSGAVGTAHVASYAIDVDIQDKDGSGT